jgi:uncharacterized membrane protein
MSLLRPDTSWHEKHVNKRTFGEMLADKVANGMGSWKFILWQSGIIVLWIIVNVLFLILQWDPYPFILLNLLFSTQAAFAAPIIMMSQNRAAQRDREAAQHDYDVNLAAKEEVEQILERIDKIVTFLAIEEITNA